MDNVSFLEGDVRTFRDAEPFDAVLGRLILFHLPDAIEVLAHHLAVLREGGVVLAVDFDGGALRAEPPVQLVATIHDWCEKAFRAAGANPVVGTRLGLLLRRAGAVDVSTFGVQTYRGPDDCHGPLWAVGLVNSLAPLIVGEGIASEADLRGFPQPRCPLGAATNWAPPTEKSDISPDPACVRIPGMIDGQERSTVFVKPLMTSPKIEMIAEHGRAIWRERRPSSITRPTGPVCCADAIAVTPRAGSGTPGRCVGVCS
jgi:hypothetical protein